jgi:hypothetical protein
VLCLPDVTAKNKEKSGNLPEKYELSSLKKLWEIV